MRDGHLEASGHNWVEGQGSGPRIDKKDGEDEDQFDAMGNKIEVKKQKKITSKARTIFSLIWGRRQIWLGLQAVLPHDQRQPISFVT